MGKKTNIDTNHKGGAQSKTRKLTTVALKVKKTPTTNKKATGKTVATTLIKRKTGGAGGSKHSKPILAAKAKKSSTTTATSTTPASTKPKKQQQLKTQTSKSVNTNAKVIPSASSSSSNSTKINPHQKSISSKSKAIKGNVNNGNSMPPVREKNNNVKPAVVGAVEKPTSDKSLLNVHHDVRLHGFSSLSQAVQKSTPKVKHLLTNECDLIMECRLCRNLFRSLPNFISHKLNYCKSLFHPAAANGCTQFIQNSSNPSQEISLQYYVVASPSKKMSQNDGERHAVGDEDFTSTTASTRLEDDAEPGPTASLYQNIQELNDEREEEGNAPATIKLALHPISGRNDSVMFQNKIETDRSVCDSTNKVFDNRAGLDRDTAMLGPDGKVICTGSARGIEKIVRHLTAQIDLAQRNMMQNSTNQFPEICDICKTVFTTEKALRQHRRDAPDCIKQSSLKCSDNEANYNINGCSTEQEPRCTSSTPDTQFPCSQCYTICQSPEELYHHLTVECSARVESFPDKPPRIGIEIRNSYKKPSESKIHPLFSEPVEDTNSNPTTLPNMYALKDMEMFQSTTNVDVNSNVPGDQPMECDDDAPHSKMKQSLPTTLVSAQLNGIEEVENDTFATHVPMDPDKECDYVSTNNVHNFGSNSLEYDGDQYQETISNLTDSGVSSGSATGISDDHYEIGQNGEINTSSCMDSVDSSDVAPALYNSQTVERAELGSKMKSKLTDDRVLAPKNKNRKLAINVGKLAGNVEAAEVLKRVSIRNLRNSKTLAGQKTLQPTTKTKKKK